MPSDSHEREMHKVCVVVAKTLAVSAIFVAGITSIVIVISVDMCPECTSRQSTLLLNFIYKLLFVMLSRPVVIYEMLLTINVT